MIFGIYSRKELTIKKKIVVYYFYNSVGKKTFLFTLGQILLFESDTRCDHVPF